MNLKAIADESLNEFVSLAEHDKRFHKNGFKKGQKCKYREGLSKGDDEDRVDAALGLFKDWIEGLEVGFATEKAADAVRCEVSGDIRFAVDASLYARSQEIIERHYKGFGLHDLDIVLPHVPFVLGDVAKDYYSEIGFAPPYGPKRIANAPSLPLVIWGNAWDQSRHHIHDIPLDQQKDLLSKIDDPVAILAPHDVVGDADGFRVIVEMTDLEKKRQNERTSTSLCCVIIGYTNSKKAPMIKDRLGLDECFSLNTIFGNRKNEYYGKDIFNVFHDELDKVLYVNTKKIGLLNEVGLGPSLQSGMQPTLFGQSSSVKSDRFYLDQMLGSITQAVRPGQAGGIIDEYARANGDIDRQREILREYAKRLGFEYKPYDKELGCPAFYVKSGNQIIKKSADVDHYDDGTLIPLDKKLHPYFLPNPADKRAFIAWSLGGNKPDEWNEGCRRFYSAFRHFKDGDGKVAGWYDLKSNKVMLVKGRVMPETVAHEIGWHATYQWAKENHPELYKTLRKYAEDATPLVKESVVEKYGVEIGAEALLDEIGAERFTRENMKAIDKASEEWWDKVERGQDDVRGRYVEANVHKTMTKEEIDEISKMTPKKAVEKLVAAMISGRRFGKMKNTVDAQDYMSLEEHDKIYHNGGYREGDACKVREGLRKSDNPDRVMKKASTMEEKSSLRKSTEKDIGKYLCGRVRWQENESPDFDTAFFSVSPRDPERAYMRAGMMQYNLVDHMRNLGYRCSVNTSGIPGGKHAPFELNGMVSKISAKEMLADVEKRKPDEYDSDTWSEFDDCDTYEDAMRVWKHEMSKWGKKAKSESAKRYLRMK